MGMSPVPRADRAALDWMRPFVHNIALNPSRYGLSPSDAQAMQKSLKLFEDAMAANQRAVSNILLRQEKNLARRQVQQLLLGYYHIIKVNNGISDASKIAIGVRPQNPSRTPRWAPGTQPSLSILAATNGVHTLKYKDTLSTGFAKPFGAVSLELHANIGDGIDRDPGNARFIGDYTRSTMIVAFSHKEDGKKATYFGRWKGTRGDVGPWSIPVSMRIAA